MAGFLASLCRAAGASALVAVFAVPAPSAAAAAAAPARTGKGVLAKPKQKGTAAFKVRSTSAARPKSWAAKDCAWRDSDVNTSRMADLMKAKGFSAPDGFAAFVAVIELKSNTKDAPIARMVTYDWQGTSDRVSGWNPASTVKIFSAVSAIELMRRQGFPKGADVVVTTSAGERSYPFTKLLSESLWASDNLAHDRLTLLAGFDDLHDSRGTLARAGLQHSAVMRAYQGKDWEAQGFDRSFRDSPALTLRTRQRTVVVPARQGGAKVDCGGAACTSLQELSKFMCVTMLHEHLPAARQLPIATKQDGYLLNVLREALRRKRDHKRDQVWEALAAAFPARSLGGYPLYKKGGFSEDWVSDSYFIVGRGSKRYLLSLAGHGGWNALDGAGRILAGLLKSGAFDPKPQAKPPKPQAKPIAKPVAKPTPKAAASPAPKRGTVR